MGAAIGYLPLTIAVGQRAAGHLAIPIVYQRLDRIALRCSCCWFEMDVQCFCSTRDPANWAASQTADLARVNLKVRLPMILERLTAWTLVIVYYTVTCGAILLGLKGAL
jgi:hypothetical protein